MDSTKIAPPRTVGFWGTSLFPLNGMIGAGIFALPAVLVAAVGNFAPWMMLVGGILFLPLALCYAWMASRFEHSGGSVLYGEAAFGRFVGFQAGWARYASAIVTAAANMHVMIAYLAAIFPWLGEPGVTPVAAGIGLALITIVNLYGMRASVGTLGVMTAIKLLPLGALIVSALFAGGDTGAVTLPQFSQVETVILLTFYAFIGFEGVVEAAGEFKHPKRDVPLSIVTMVSGVTLLYMAIIWAFNAIGPEFAGEDNALAGVAGASMGQLGSLAIVVAASFSIGANNFASGGAQPRLMYGMAEQGQAPRIFAATSRHGVPWVTVLFMAGTLLCGVVLNYLIPENVFVIIASIATFATVWVWLMILLSQVAMRRRLSAEEVRALKFKVPLWPVGPALAIAFMLFVIGVLGTME
ncbi:MAG: amino acid permease, partial [Pseudomonadota bacterium]|nr:amino acid permease [Pseudomonadota bacterium]